jgi:hypothetical protein
MPDAPFQRGLGDSGLLRPLVKVEPEHRRLHAHDQAQDPHHALAAPTCPPATANPDPLLAGDERYNFVLVPWQDSRATSSIRMGRRSSAPWCGSGKATRPWAGRRCQRLFSRAELDDVVTKVDVRTGKATQPPVHRRRVGRGFSPHGDQVIPSCARLEGEVFRSADPACRRRFRGR